ncbi:hypothetical protein EJB05_21380, partial [Eragrostis curvula]
MPRICSLWITVDLKRRGRGPTSLDPYPEERKTGISPLKLVWSTGKVAQRGKNIVCVAPKGGTGKHHPAAAATPTLPLPRPRCRQSGKPANRATRDDGGGGAPPLCPAPKHASAIARVRCYRWRGGAARHRGSGGAGPPSSSTRGAPRMTDPAQGAARSGSGPRPAWFRSAPAWDAHLGVPCVLLCYLESNLAWSPPSSADATLGSGPLKAGLVHPLGGFAPSPPLRGSPPWWAGRRASRDATVGGSRHVGFHRSLGHQVGWSDALVCVSSTAAAVAGGGVEAGSALGGPDLGVHEHSLAPMAGEVQGAGRKL